MTKQTEPTALDVEARWKTAVARVTVLKPEQSRQYADNLRSARLAIRHKHAEMQAINALNLEPALPKLDVRPADKPAERIAALRKRFAQTLEDMNRRASTEAASSAKKETNCDAKATDEARTDQDVEDEREDENADGEGRTDLDLEDEREELRAFEAE